MPQMLVARQSCSSCVVNGHIYVFCGYNSTHRYLRSVEKLDLSKSDDQLEWKIIPYANLCSEFIARTCPLVCQLSSTEVLIMGGRSNGKQNDTFVMQIESDKIEHIATVGPLKFWSDNNAIFSVSDDKIMALIYGNDRKAHLMEYTRGADTFITKESFQ